MLGKRIFGLVLASVFVSIFFIISLADGGAYTSMETVANVEELEVSGEYACLREVSTGEIVFEKNSTDAFHIGHLAKLMTIYLTARQIESGEISLDTSVMVSPLANKQNGTQIWLNSGEKINIEQLLKSICMGNGNDACYCLGEALFKNEQTYVDVANQTAVSLGMENTHFVDITGQNAQSVTTAKDISILASELSEYDYLGEYFCQWIDYVRDGQTELVNTNRLVKSYDGIKGMKACYDEESQNSVVAVANRNSMTFVGIVAGCDDVDESFSSAKKLLDFGFSAYQLYTPEIPQDALKKVSVSGGSKSKIGVEVKNVKPVLIKKGTMGNITPIFEVEETLNAPIKKGEKVGEIRFLNDEGVVYEGEIVTKENVSEMTFSLALKRLWLKLLNFEG